MFKGVHALEIISYLLEHYDNMLWKKDIKLLLPNIASNRFCCGEEVVKPDFLS